MPSDDPYAVFANSTFFLRTSFAYASAASVVAATATFQERQEAISDRYRLRLKSRCLRAENTEPVCRSNLNR